LAKRHKSTLADIINPEKLLAIDIENAGLPPPIPQYKFHPKRRWRADFGWPDFFCSSSDDNGDGIADEPYKLLVEVEGGIWMPKGRHIHPVGFTNDVIKYNNAVLLGWHLLRFTTDMVRDGTAINMLISLFKGATNGTSKD
jgi:hypothetical protein